MTLSKNQFASDVRQFTFCQVLICLRTGSKFRCIRSMPTEMQSTSDNDFECFASTGVKSPTKAMFEQTNTE